MKKFSAVIAALALTLGFSFAGASVASASPATTLSYADFTASAGYLELQAAMATSNTYLQSRDNIVVDVQTSESIAGQSVSSAVHMEGNKTASRATMSMPDPVSGTTATISYGFANGSYYEAVTGWPGLEDPNSQAAMKRLGKTVNSTVVLETQTAPDGLTSIDPVSLFDGSSTNVTQGLTSTTDGLTFSPVVKSNDVSLDGAVDYSYSLSTPANILFDGMTFDLVFKVAPTGLLYSMSLNGGLSGLLEMNVSATISSPDTLNLTLPTDTFKVSAFTKVSKQISAEKTVTTKANAIATKARALAKASKKALVAKNITDAAKALKYTVSAVKNGVKLTGKYQGVSGSMCVIANKGAATVGNC